MAGITVYSGATGPFYFFEQTIARRVEAGNADYIYILPVNRAVRRLKKRLIGNAKDHILIDPPIYTFNQLFMDIYQRLSQRRRVLTDDMMLVLTDTILRQMAEKSQFLIQTESLPSGIISKTNTILNELRRFGFTAETFRRLDHEEKKRQPAKYRDMFLLLSHLEQSLGNTCLDEPFALHEAAQNISEPLFHSIWPQAKDIYISGYGLFTPAMYRFIEKAAAWCTIHIKLDYNGDNLDLFKHTSAAAGRFQRMGAQFDQSSRGTALHRFLFNRSLKEGHQRLNFKKRLSLAELTNRKEEVQFIARTIRSEHIEQKVPLNRMAVTFTRMDVYVPLVRQIFREYGIPCNISTGFALNQSPLIRQFLNALQLIENRFDQRQVLRWFNNVPSRNYMAFDVRTIQRLCADYRIVRFEQGWAEWIKKVLKENDVKSGLAEPEYLQQQIDHLNKALQHFYCFPKKATVDAFRNAFIQLLQANGLIKWYEKENPYLNERHREHEFRAFNRFMKLFERMIWTMDFIHGSNEISFNVFFRALQQMINNGIYNLKELPDYGVQVMPRLEIQALDYQRLFIAGLVDGEFPRASVKDVFFNDHVRASMGLIAAEELLHQDRLVFYNLIESSAERCYLTYPRYEEETALVPSSFIADLRDVAEVEQIPQKKAPDSPASESQLWMALSSGLQSTDPASTQSLKQTVSRILAAPSANFENNQTKLLRVLEGIERIRQRVSTREPGAYEGVLGNSAAIHKRLQARYHADYPWSPTQLEQYAACPMQFFLERLLKLEEWPEVEKELTALERGAAVHQILQRFYSGLSEGERLTPLEERQRLRDIANEIFARFEFKGFFWELERIRYFGSEQQAGLWDAFLQLEQQEIDQNGFYPGLLEWAFGPTGKDEKDETSQEKPALLYAGDQSFQLSGKIDRVDLDADKKRALIFDYKTGASSIDKSPRSILEGLQLQLPLYAKALMSVRKNLQVVYAAYYLVKDGDNCERLPQIADKEEAGWVSKRAHASLPNKNVIDTEGNEYTFESLLETAVGIAWQKIEQLRSGQFRHTAYPDRPFCQRWCTYRRMCQKNVRKLKMLNREI